MGFYAKDSGPKWVFMQRTAAQKVFFVTEKKLLSMTAAQKVFFVTEKKLLSMTAAKIGFCFTVCVWSNNHILALRINPRTLKYLTI